MHLDKNITSPQDGYVMLLFNGVSQEFSHKKTEEYFLIWLCCNAIENSTWYRFCFSRLQVPLTNLDVSTHKVNSQFQVFDNILQPQQLTQILPPNTLSTFPQTPSKSHPSRAATSHERPSNFPSILPMKNEENHLIGSSKPIRYVMKKRKFKDEIHTDTLQLTSSVS